MRLSKAELNVLKETINGNREVKNIALALRKSDVQIYRIGQQLIEKGFVERSDGRYALVRNTITNVLAQLLEDSPAIIEPLSGSGIKLLLFLLEPKTLNEIKKEALINRTQIFKKLKQARAISLVKKVEGKYVLNEKLWAKTIDFLKEIKKWEELTDARIPASATIYYKTEKEIVFSSKEIIDAPLTAFSVYGQYGIKIFTLKNYYYLPKKKLSKREIFLHSLYIAEKEQEPKDILFIALFYAKYKKELRKIKHSILDNLNNIFEGKHISGYPAIDEIKDRAEIYDIKI